MAEFNKENRTSSEFSEECAVYDNVKLSLVSEQAELVSDEDEADVNFPPDIHSQVEQSRTEMTCLAKMYKDEGRIKVEYDDASVDSDGESVKTYISFDPHEPSCVIIERTGIIRSVMVFEQGRFHRGEYITPYLSFDVAVSTRSLRNTLSSSGGELYLDYAVELKGAASIRTKMTITVSPL